MNGLWARRARVVWIAEDGPSSGPTRPGAGWCRPGGGWRSLPQARCGPGAGLARARRGLGAVWRGPGAGWVRSGASRVRARCGPGAGPARPGTTPALPPAATPKLPTKGICLMRIGHLPAVIRFRINGFSVVGKYMFGAMPSKGRPARDATLTRRQHRQSTHTAGCGPPGKASTRAAGTGRTRPQRRRSDWPSTNSCADRRHRRPATSWLTTGQAAVKPARRPSTHAAGLAATRAADQTAKPDMQKWKLFELLYGFPGSRNTGPHSRHHLPAQTRGLYRRSGRPCLENRTEVRFLATFPPPVWQFFPGAADGCRPRAPPARGPWSGHPEAPQLVASRAP